MNKLLKFLKSEFTVFLCAIQYYTRIPVNFSSGNHPDFMRQSTRYLPLVGITTGAVGAFTCYLASLLFPIQVSVILSMVATLLFTGAFHEDGLADSCDGFGGGYSRDKILEIMKDSRIGSYGSIGLWVTLTLKYSCLTAIDTPHIFADLIMAHALSRLSAVSIMLTTIYARTQDSKVKAVVSQGSVQDKCTLLIFGLAPLFFLPLHSVILIVVILLVFVTGTIWYIKRKLGGYTGDVLGAVQQISEILVYLTLLATKTLFL
jgi:adenosylcobinamide-GDP ribazoletransferase